MIFVGVAEFVDACLEMVYAAGPSSGGQASDQLMRVAGKDVIRS